MKRVLCVLALLAALVAGVVVAANYLRGNVASACQGSDC